MKYYKEIDGLRAVAVISVILYHLDFSFVPGGFIGVDIFFVISGFLITKSIRSDIQANTYTIAGFYDRRIRRIIPALIFVVIVVTIFSIYILPPNELQEYYKSVFSVSTFTSNIFFWKYSDYFSAASELKPLLHTWSLGIEEQFYIIFPVFMLLTRKASDKNIIIFLSIFTLASFIISVVPAIGVRNPVATFYLPFTRFWELFVGALLAINIRRIPCKRVVLNNVTSLTGLVLIISSVALLDKNSVFSGMTVLYAVLGTALIIYSGSSGTILSVVLTNKFVVYLGLISYSLYLWHWPVIALIKNTTVGELDIKTQLLVLGVTFSLSTFTYSFVEQPFRKNKKLKSFLRIRTGILALASLTAISGVIVYTMDSRETKPLLTTDTLCFDEEETLRSTERCSFGTLNTSRIFLLYGDSHSNALFPAFQKFASDNGYRGIIARSWGCAPVFGVFRRDGVNTSGCTGKFSANVRKFLKENHEHIEMIFMVSRWTLYEKGWIIDGRLQKGTHYLSDFETISLTAAESAKVLKKAFLKTVDEMTTELGIKVTILAPVPDLPTHINKLKQPLSRESYISQRIFIDEMFKTFETNPLVKILDPIDILCGADICNTYADDGTTPLYVDDNHLTLEGALLFYPHLKQFMN